VGHVAQMGAMRNAYKILVTKPEETTQKTLAYMGSNMQQLLG
jgi:hypothetical protein